MAFLFYFLSKIGYPPMVDGFKIYFKR